jgi:hypothetical protein
MVIDRVRDRHDARAARFFRLGAITPLDRGSRTALRAIKVGGRLMIRTGKEHLESIRDGRVVYIGSGRVDDVTRHPAFRNAARTVAALYDMKEMTRCSKS